MISKDAQALGRELERLVRELRRGDRAVASVADAAHRLAQALADAAADARGDRRRPVPRLADHALADQVAVVGRELLDALAAGHEADLDAVVAALRSLRGPSE
ncbi:hypothetical protein [Jiangella asiatica]|uniref:Uncharacterized protein n=1 Tax=Jiangella asiatica TaxID=2530372 RepID=A0A4R5D6N9_9ACTN|nr:hypothetical protein [Jiangella asiatica]TDE09139.1 hypothetical protein E1269_15630 [Jiangella asiatica]